MDPSNNGSLHPASRTPLRILIVEDHGIIALGLKRELASLGHDVVGVADNARDALNAASELKPDLVLMDIGLEGETDGIGAASAIRCKADIPVIFLTAQSDPGTLERARKVSPAGYVLKPFDRADLMDAISRALTKPAGGCESGPQSHQHE